LRAVGVISMDDHGVLNCQRLKMM